MPLLEMKDLHTFFRTKRGIVKAVNGVSYSVDAGKTLGVVGESGSGKSVSAMSMLQLLDGNGYIDSGEIIFDGVDLTKLSRQEMYKVRGNKISVIFQEPMTSLNPVFTIERQISEPFMVHRGMNKKEAAAESVKMLAAVKIPNPEVVAKQYPHQLSGGMRQRVMIAMALAFNILLFWKWKCRKKKWLKGVLISTSAKDLFFGRNHIFSLHTDPEMIIYPCYLWHTGI